MQNTYLIADSGSTKTDWVLKNSDGAHAFQSAGINPFYQTTEEIIPVLEKEVVPNVIGTVDKVFFFGAGCANEKTGKPVFDALTKCISSANMIEVASDMLGAARGLCGHEPGLACILGTGANNAYYDGANIVRSIGSLGFWLGDEGSGSYLGKTLVVYFLQNELPEHLHVKFSMQFSEVNRLSVLDNAYKKPYPNRYFASFSKFIAENKSDPFLENLVWSAFAIFAKKYICKHPEAQTVPIHFTGSVAYYYQDILTNVLETLNLKPGRILRSPLEGLLQYYSELPQ